MTLRRRLALGTLLAAALLLLLLPSIERIVAADGSLSALIAFGCLEGVACPARANRELMPPAAWISSAGGYDGQFYYYIAAGIYLGEEFVLDARELRLSRIGLPLLSGWAALISAEALVVVQSLLPLAAHLFAALCFAIRLYSASPGVGAGAGAADRGEALSSALAFALMLLSPAILLSLSLALAEPLAAALLWLSLFALLPRDAGVPGSGRMVVAALLLSLATLSRETLLALPLVSCAGGILFLALRAWRWRFCRSCRAEEMLLERRVVALFIVSLFALLLPAIWWFSIGYSPQSVATRGTLPIVTGRGIETLFTGEGGLAAYGVLRGGLFIFLVLALFAFLVDLASTLWSLRQSALRRNKRPSLSIQTDGSAWALFLRAVVSSAAILSSGFVLAATVEEYWIVYANIVRLYTPLFLLLSLRLMLPRLLAGMWVAEHRVVAWSLRLAAAWALLIALSDGVQSGVGLLAVLQAGS